MNTRMTRWIAVVGLVAMLAATAGEAWARAGRGGSFGSRGSRGFSAPTRPFPGQTTPARPATPFDQSAAQRPGGFGGFGGLGGMLGGLLVGGLIGSLLFGGGMRPGMLGGGFGLLELLLVAGAAYFIYSMLRRRQQPEPAVAGGYRPASGQESAPWPAQPGGQSAATATAEAPSGPTDLERGLGHIRQMDPTFDVRAATSAVSDIFFRVQAAWMARDMTPVRDVLASEMHAAMQADSDRLRAERKLNRLENIAIRSADATEAWQEGGQDFVTICFLASVLDYTVDEATNQVTEGSRTEPVKFEEYWTFVRPVGSHPWKLSAIQQAS